MNRGMFYLSGSSLILLDELNYHELSLKLSLQIYLVDPMAHVNVALNFNAFLQQTKLKDDGSNYTDWVRNLRIILIAAKRAYVLEAPLGDAPVFPTTQDVMNAWQSRSDDYSLVQCGMLYSLESGLQKRFEQHGAYEMLQSLPPSYKSFVMNLNMQGMENTIPELYLMLKSAEVEIKKEHQVLIVNKTTSFKKGKGKKNFKKDVEGVAVPGKSVAGKKPKHGPKPETECFYCKGNGHWKRNCPKYLAEKKDGKVNKGIFDIHVIDVYLTNTRSSTWVYDTGSVAYICNSKQ